MRRWYILDAGRATGPFQCEEIQERLKSGQLRTTDLLFLEGDKIWRPLSQFSEFVSESAQTQNESVLENNTFVSPSQNQWVLLKIKGDEAEPQYEQEGPYSTAQITQWIHSGTLKFSDYIWRSGFSNWRQIRNCTEFGNLEKSALQNAFREVQKEEESKAIKTPQSEVESKDDLLGSVVQQEREEPVTMAEPVEEKPSEAEGEDLAEPFALTKTGFEVPVLKPYEKTAQDSVQAEKSEAVKESVAKEPKVEEAPKGGYNEDSIVKKIPRKKAIVAASGILIFALGSMMAARYVVDKEVHAIKSVKKESQKTPKIGVRHVRKKQVVAEDGEYLRLKIEEGLEPRLFVQTKTESRGPLVIEVNGEPGEITEGIRFFVKKTLHKLDGDSRLISLKNWGLKDGFYKVRIQLGDLQEKAQFFVGGSKDEVDYLLQQQRPRVVLRQKHEKELMAALSGFYGKQAKSLLKHYRKHRKSRKRWQSTYKKWRSQLLKGKSAKLIEFDNQAFSEKAFPEHIKELNSMRKKLLKMGSRIDRNVRNRRRVSTTKPVVKLQRELARLNKKVKKLRVIQP
jgi:hypothetical protein